jgi:tRNA threonylcarbamoyladenosine biosynthesis protein TsaE
MQNITTNSDIETMAAGEAFSKTLKAGDVVALYGDLGAGKTVFVKGIARGLGIEGPVTSPTFTILKEYEGRAPLYHFDVYRIEDTEEMDEIGFFDYLGGEGVSVIEWAEKVDTLLPEGTIRVVIEKTGEDAVRKISIRGGSGEVSW